jgi:NTE family protein
MIKNIVFSGGAFKGWAYIGTIRALNELTDFRNVESVTGVSIGSVFALFYILQIDYRELLNFIMKINFSEIIDFNINNILINQSIIDGIKYIEYIKSILSLKIDPDITFQQLYKYSNIKYIIPALNITDSKLEYFDYINTPDVKIIDAILASSSLPILFPTIKINGKKYCDGGLCNNCPVDMLPETCTIAFDLDIVGNNTTSFNIINLIFSLSNIIHANNSKKNKDITFNILDSKFMKELLNLNQTRDDIFNIYMTGYINSRNIIYNNFIAIKN